MKIGWEHLSARFVWPKFFKYQDIDARRWNPYPGQYIWKIYVGEHTIEGNHIYKSSYSCKKSCERMIMRLLK